QLAEILQRYLEDERGFRIDIAVAGEAPGDKEAEAQAFVLVGDAAAGVDALLAVEAGGIGSRKRPFTIQTVNGGSADLLAVGEVGRGVEILGPGVEIEIAEGHLEIVGTEDGVHLVAPERQIAIIQP